MNPLVMFETITDWVERLSAKPLPVMRRTLTRVKDLLVTPNACRTGLSEIVALDPGFSLHLFQRLHRLSRHPKEPVTKITNAITLLGMVAIEEAAHSLPVLEDRLQGPPRRGLIDCYSRAAHAAIYAVGLAKRRHQHDPQLFATAALLHDIGEMSLWVQAPEVMRSIHRLIQQGDGRDDAAMQVLGFTLEELNQHLSKRWELPALVQDSQGLFNSYQPGPLTVMLACAVARASALDWRGRELKDYLELLADFLTTSVDRVEAEFHQHAAHAARRLSHLPLPLPARQLVLIRTSPPSDTAGSTNHRVVSRPSSDASKVAAPTAAEPQQTPQLGPISAGQSNPLQQRLSQTVSDMQQIYGLKCIMFALLSSDKTRLKARFVVGDADAVPLQGFIVDLVAPSLFTLLMKKPQALWLNAENRDKYLPMLPASVTHCVCKRGFLLMSIFLQNKPIGLFYADNGHSESALTVQQYNDFKASCQRFMQSLA